MTTTKLYSATESVTCAVVGGNLYTVEDGVVRIYDSVAGHLVRAGSDAPSVASIRRAVTMGRTRTIRI